MFLRVKSKKNGAEYLVNFDLVQVIEIDGQKDEAILYWDDRETMRIESSASILAKKLTACD